MVNEVGKLAPARLYSYYWVALFAARFEYFNSPSNFDGGLG